MSRKLTAAVITAAMLAGASLSAVAADQITPKVVTPDPTAKPNIFTTKDFRKDRAMWADPAYYNWNTAGQIGGMAFNIVSYEESGQVGGARLYGSKGTVTKAGVTHLESPYPYKTALEQYNDWLKKAKGGTKHTRADLPDWTGTWAGGGGGGGGAASPGDMMKYLKPKYQETMVQSLRATAQARAWQRACLPGGFFNTIGFEEIYLAPDRIVSVGSGNASNTVRWIFTDGKGHVPANLQFPKWGGEPVGFWDGDTLIVHTNQNRGWRGGPGGEYSDELETVEKYHRNGDVLEGEITIYDPEVFTMPVYQKMNKRLVKNTKLEERPLINTCTDTNGPSPSLFTNANGFSDERIPGDPGFDWDVADPRPWATGLNESDKRYAAYLAKGGKMPTMYDVTPPRSYKDGTGKAEAAPVKGAGGAAGYE